VKRKTSRRGAPSCVPAGSARCGFSISAPYSTIVPMVPTSASTLPGQSGHPDHVTGELQVLLQWEGGTVEHDADVAVANALDDLVEGRAVVQVEAGDDVATADHRGDQCNHVLVSGVGGLHGVHAVDDRCLQLLSGPAAASPRMPRKRPVHGLIWGFVR
jgi:hypothetical protein